MTPKVEKKIKVIGLLLVGLLLGYGIYITKIYLQTRKELKTANINMADMRKIISTKTKINLEEVLSEPIYLPGEDVPVYHTKYLSNPDVDKETAKRLVISDSTINYLVNALKLKSQEVKQITNLYTTIKAENLKLAQNKGNNKNEYTYEDEYISLAINDSTKSLTHFNIKNDLALVNYYKKKNIFGRKVYYTSALTRSPYLRLDSIKSITKEQPITRFLMNLDTRYYNTFKNNDMGFMVSTLNLELNTDKTFSYSIGAGIKTNMEYIQTVYMAGFKINIWRIKK